MVCCTSQRQRCQCRCLSLPQYLHPAAGGGTDQQHNSPAAKKPNTHICIMHVCMYVCLKTTYYAKIIDFGKT